MKHVIETVSRCCGCGGARSLSAKWLSSARAAVFRLRLPGATLPPFLFFLRKNAFFAAVLIDGELRVCTAEYGKGPQWRP